MITLLWRSKTVKKMIRAAGVGLLFLAVLPLSPASAGEEPLEKLKAGKAAFDVECRKCHTPKYALDETYSRDDWEMTVNMMRSNGAEITDEQKWVIIDYLTAKSLLETKCSVCHEIERPLSKTKSPADWLATVTRMSGKKAGHLSEEEVRWIAAYLAMERPAAE